MEANGEALTRAGMDCFEACLLPRGRWHCSPTPRRGLCSTRPRLCHGAGSSLASRSGLGGGASTSTLERWNLDLLV